MRCSLSAEVMNGRIFNIGTNHGFRGRTVLRNRIAQTPTGLQQPQSLTCGRILARSPRGRPPASKLSSTALRMMRASCVINGWVLLVRCAMAFKLFCNVSVLIFISIISILSLIPSCRRVANWNGLGGLSTVLSCSNQAKPPTWLFLPD